ncbi:BTAD domain-containing putative transcriptional regulator [Pseudonocardia sp.]|uniref:BTAD domain-containing putative transcriptional regulator n=1 Tax=Pseudonocardia sp. TaxID=60912 RepID=UPI00262CC527|nr:BTAD domain-containing putative transcriptional regulator [Pseudonocardia sp.]
MNRRQGGTGADRRPHPQRAPALVLRVCGDFAATVEGSDVPLGGRRQKAVLARVLAGDGDVVSAEQVVEDIWGERSSDSTVASVHAYVSRLRRLLGSTAIPRRAGGYVLDRQVIAVDSDLFEADVAQGRRALARGDDAAAEGILETALARWSGPSAFGDMRDSHFLAPAAARLEELRVVAGEILADARARLGRSADDVVLLEELAARDPLRESVAVRLVRALYAAGRQADALAAFERCRRALADQLGVDPAPPLRRIHAAVLAQEPLALADGSVLPTHLPPRNRSFVGRDALLARVQAALDDDERRPRAVALTGLAGIGKTELALELAHRRLRESRVAWWIAAEDPVGTAAGLGDLAVALGIAPFERGEDTRAALWAELDRTPGWIIVFDNADDPAQLEPFLPAARHGDVVITSRNPAWRRIAHPLPVTPLARPESVAYVAARTGGDDCAEAAELAELLGDLPLALEQASAYIEQTGMSLPDYVRLFRERRASLLLRDTSASGPTVATTWGLAFDRLRGRSSRATEMLETLAFLSPDAIDVGMLRPLAGDELDLHDVLAELMRLSLVDREAGVLRIHRLVQDVVRARLPESMRRLRLAGAAAMCLAQTDTDGVGHEGIDAHLICLAAHAETLDSVPRGLVEALDALARRYAERALYPAAEHVLRAALRLHGGTGDPLGRGELTCRLGEVLDAAGHLAPALVLHREAVRILSAVASPDSVVLAHAYNRLGHVLNCADDAGAAIDAHERALRVLRGAGREDLVAPVLVDLGYTLWGAGRLDAAGEAFRSGRVLLEREGKREHRDWAHATAGLGMVEQDAGRVVEAIELQRTAIAAFTLACGPDHPDTAQALDKLGYALRLQGRSTEAVDAHHRAVRLLERVLGVDDSRVGMALTNLGLAYADAGRLDQAVEVQTRARSVLRSALGPAHGSTVLAARRLSLALAECGQTTRARAVIDEVLALVAERPDGNPAERARIDADAAIVYALAGPPSSP